MDWKNIIVEIKILVKEFFGILDRLDRDEERNSELEDKLEEFIGEKVWINRRMKNIEGRLRYVEDIYKRYNIRLIVILEGKGRGKRSRSNIGGVND